MWPGQPCPDARAGRRAVCWRGAAASGQLIIRVPFRTNRAATPTCLSRRLRPVPNSPVTGDHLGSGDRGGIIAVAHQSSPSLVHLLSRAARWTRSKKFRTNGCQIARSRASFKTAAGRSLGVRGRLEKDLRRGARVSLGQAGRIPAPRSDLRRLSRSPRARLIQPDLVPPQWLLSRAAASHPPVRAASSMSVNWPDMSRYEYRRTTSAASQNTAAIIGGSHTSYANQ